MQDRTSCTGVGTRQSAQLRLKAMSLHAVKMNDLKGRLICVRRAVSLSLGRVPPYRITASGRKPRPVDSPSYCGNGKDQDEVETSGTVRDGGTGGRLRSMR